MSSTYARAFVCVCVCVCTCAWTCERVCGMMEHTLFENKNTFCLRSLRRTAATMCNYSHIVTQGPQKMKEKNFYVKQI